MAETAKDELLRTTNEFFLRLEAALKEERRLRSFFGRLEHRLRTRSAAPATEKDEANG